MGFITLHDHLNPSQEVPVRSESILAITPFGSGSALQLADGPTVGVHETPSQVAEIIKNA